MVLRGAIARVDAIESATRTKRPMDRDPWALSLLHKLAYGTQVVASVYVALGIRGHAVRHRRCAGIRVGARIGDEGSHRAVLRASNSNPAPRADVHPVASRRQTRDALFRAAVARLGIGDIHDIVPVDVDAARAPELEPLGNEAAVGVEDLHTVVLPIRD